MKTLVLYATREGQTRKIATRIVETLKGLGVECDLFSFDEIGEPDWSLYDRVLLGSSIRYGVYQKVFRRFVERHLDRLAAVPNGFFAVNLVARKEGKNTPETNVYTRHYLEKTSWKPDLCSVFAGALLYPRYNFLERAILRLLMSYTGGPTDPTKEYVFTDWDKVEAFAKEAAALTAKRG